MKNTSKIPPKNTQHKQTKIFENTRKETPFIFFIFFIFSSLIPFFVVFCPNQSGKAYVCHQTKDDISRCREIARRNAVDIKVKPNAHGDPCSPWRDRPIQVRCFAVWRIGDAHGNRGGKRGEAGGREGGTRGRGRTGLCCRGHGHHSLA